MSFESPKLQMSPIQKGSLPPGGSKNNPEKITFNPEKHFSEILNDLKEKKIFEDFKISRTKKGAYKAIVYMENLKYTIERTDQQSPTRIIFYLTNHSVGSDTHIPYNTSSTIEIMRKRISDLINKRWASKSEISAGFLKGLNNEKRVSDILENLQKSEFIEKFTKADHEDDTKRKRDFMIEYKSFIVPLQIKSSEAGQRKHIVNEQGVPSIVIHNQDTQDSIKERIMKILEAYITKGEILHL